MIGYANENYQIPVSQLKGVRYMHAEKWLFPSLHTTLPRHLASIALFTYNFLMMGIDNQL